MRHRRLGSAVVILTLTIFALIATAPVASAANSTLESQFVSKINAERTKRGLSALVAKSDLRSVARAHSDKMAAKGDIWHNPKLGSQVSGWRVLGENVGMGGSVNSLHTAFMNSPGHRANVLDRDYNQIGVGVTVDGDGTVFVTEVFAGRGSSGTKTVSSTGSERKVSTVSKPASRPASKPAARPAAKPKPRPAQPVAEPRTVSMLVQLHGLDASAVDPGTGRALGS